MREIAIKKVGDHTYIAELPETMVINTQSMTAIIMSTSKAEPAANAAPAKAFLDIIATRQAEPVKREIARPDDDTRTRLRWKEEPLQAGGNSKNSNNGNSARVLKLLQTQGALSTHEIAAKLGLARAQVSYAANHLSGMGYIRPTAHKRSPGVPGTRAATVWEAILSGEKTDPRPIRAEPVSRKPTQHKDGTLTALAKDEIIKILRGGSSFGTTELASMVGVDRKVAWDALEQLKYAGAVHKTLKKEGFSQLAVWTLASDPGEQAKSN